MRCVTLPAGPTAPSLSSLSSTTPCPVLPSSRRRVWHAASPAGCRQTTTSTSQMLPTQCMGTSAATAAAEVPSSPCPHQMALYRAAKSQLLSGRRSDALATLQQGLAQYPSDKHMLALSATLLTKSNQLTAARSVLHTAMQLYPDHLPFITAAAMLDVRLGQPHSAAQRLEAAVTMFPDNPVLHQLMGEVMVSLGEHQRARQSFQNALRLRPAMPHTYAAWAQLEVACDNVDLARQVYSMGVLAVPNHAPLLHAWASLEHELGQHSIAKHLCEAALGSDPQHIPSYMLLGQLEWVQGNLPAARTAWERGNNTPAGPSAPLLCYWAQREARVNNHKTARDLLEAALRASPGDAHAATQLATLQDRGGAEQAAADTYTALLTSGRRDTQTPAAASVAATSTAAGLLQAAAATWQQQQQAAQSADVTFSGASPAQSGGAAGLQSQSHGAVEGNGTHQAAATHDASSASHTFVTPAIAVLVARCQQLLRQRQVEEVEDLLCQVEVLDPHNGHLCHLRGLLAQKEGLFSQAETWFRRGRYAPPAQGGLLCWEGLAELLAFQGLTDDARSVWRGGSAHARRRYWAHRASDHSLPTTQHASATTLVDSAPSSQDRAQSPSSVDGSSAQGLGADRGGGRPSSGDSSGWYVGCSSRYLRQWALFEKKSGRAEDAARLFAAAANKDPQDYKTWLAWAVLERRRGHVQSAEQLFRRGITVAPRNPHLWYAYTTMLWRLKGDVNSARSALRRATSLCPRSVALWLEWALLEWKGAGDPLAARQLLKKGAAVPLAQPYGPLYEAWAQLDRELMGRGRSMHDDEDSMQHALRKMAEERRGGEAGQGGAAVQQGPLQQGVGVQGVHASMGQEVSVAVSSQKLTV